MCKNCVEKSVLRYKPCKCLAKYVRGEIFLVVEKEGRV